MRLQELETEFFSNLKSLRKSENTLKNYRTDINCFNDYLMKQKGSVTLNDFQNSEIFEYAKFLQQKYSSDNSRRRKLQTLRIFFDFLVKKQIVPSNPVREISTSPKFLDIPRPTSFIDIKTLWTHLIDINKSDVEMENLLNMRNQIIILLIFGSGLKVSTLSILKSPTCVPSSASPAKSH